MLAWNKSLETGIPGVDDQHKMLIILTNDLMDAVANGKGEEAVGNMLEYLIEYTYVHFRDEESIQIKYKFPKYEEHKKIHDAFRIEVRAFKADYDKNGASLSLESQVVARMGNWLITHIGKEDKLIADYMRSIRAI